MPASPANRRIRGRGGRANPRAARDRHHWDGRPNKGVAIGWAWGRGFKLQILNFKLQGRGGGLGVKEILDSGFWMVELDEEIRTANSHEFSRIRKIFGSGSESPIYNFCFLFSVYCPLRLCARLLFGCGGRAKKEFLTTIGAQRRWTDWEIKSLLQIARIAQLEDEILEGRGVKENLGFWIRLCLASPGQVLNWRRFFNRE